jgi:proline racemase
VATELRTTDYHTAGEPFRIVLEGVPPIPGATVRERREAAARTEEIDRLRRLLCHEPRGHADMYGCFFVPPDDDGADLAVLFWHKDGYSTACGHGTIALGAWAVESGRITAPADGTVDVTIDVPSGRVVASVSVRGGAVEQVGFRNVAARVVARDVQAGGVAVDVAWAARTALLAADGVLADGQTWRNESIVGTSFDARALRRVPDGLLTEVVGTAFRTGEHRFVLDPRDPLNTGFVLR